MAILKDLIVNGSARFIGDVYLNTIKSGTWLGSAIQDSYISSASTWNSKQNALTAGSNITISGNTISATNTTYSDFIGSGANAAHGLVPKPSTTAGTTKYLREDGTWQTPPDNNTTYNVVSNTTNGLVKAPNNDDSNVSSTKATSAYYVYGIASKNSTPAWYKLPDNAFSNTTYESLPANGGTADYLSLTYCNSSTNSNLWNTIKNGTSSTRTTNRVNFYTIYDNGGPTTYGEMLEICSYNANHWQPQLWFGSGKEGRLLYRNKTYNNDTWGDWRTVAWRSDIPTNISSLTNDSGFITSSSSITGTAGALSNTSKTDPGSACSDGQNVKWFSLISLSSGYAGTNAGFPVSNNANGILWLGTHSGPYGHQLGFSSNGHIYDRYISNNTFSTTADGGSWNRIAFTGEALPANGGSASHLKSCSTTDVGLTYYYIGGSTSNTTVNRSWSGYKSTTTYNSILRLLSHDENYAFYIDLIFDVNSDNLWYRRVTDGGTPSLRLIDFAGDARPAKISTGTASTLTSLDSSKDVIFATVTGATNITLSNNLTTGKNLTVVIYNNSNSIITLPIPTTSGWNSLDSEFIIYPKKFAEFGILCYLANNYLISIKA